MARKFVIRSRWTDYSLQKKLVTGYEKKNFSICWNWSNSDKKEKIFNIFRVIN